MAWNAPQLSLSEHSKAPLHTGLSRLVMPNAAFLTDKLAFILSRCLIEKREDDCSEIRKWRISYDCGDGRNDTSLEDNWSAS